MCGFAGIISWSDKHRVHRDVLEKMSARIAHRGPDGSGLYLNHEGEASPENPQVGLVHRRLAIIDLDPRANQPFADSRGRQLVFNGEIYNYRELRRELEGLLPGYAWKTQSDTEVLLAGYEAWGEKCVEHFNGMFAFAIWEPDKRKLFLARDRMGQKPLYYKLTQGRYFDPPFEAIISGESPPPEHGNLAVAFASESEALRSIPWAVDEKGISNESLREYLSWGYCFRYQPAFRNLKPGASMSVYGPPTSPYLRSRTYQKRLIGGPVYKRYASLTDRERAAKARELLETAVRRQLVADVPVGCFLSGGMDSSVIAAAMKVAVPDGQRVMTFSIGFDDPRYDETKFAAAVAAHLKTEHHAFTVRPDAIADLPKLAEVFGEPFGDSSALPTHYLARETRKHVKVVLSGDGGDELFGGYDRYRALQMTERLRQLPPPLRALLLGKLTLRAAVLIPGSHPKSLGARVKRLLATASLPARQRYDSYMRLFDEATVDALCGPYAPRGKSKSEWRTERSEEAFRSPTGELVPAALSLDRGRYLPGDLLTKVDRCSMLHALEVRSPFMDHELVEFASTLTTAQLLNGGPKRMLREAFAADLPSWVFKRKKMGFAVPIGEWFRGPLRAMLRDHLFAADSFARGHFNMPVIERLIDEHERERIDHSQRLYALLMLELWWKTQGA